ncbi:V-type ATP synthase subunit A [Pseudoflavonifractor sp. BIOML-A6]|nr:MULTISPECIES: V-type ATP synthase subunit A [unclassified Pseudoflavonifractor]MTQ96153.1 V-type ATP synthase subunit A [Pseudoflavonifractor sp. BIOML-A16]MTR06293.1 V-type ATP synthase subunit A [Pseudoflavonifractor sp. BIOML-A15]MTR73453.1 V-type ATP synthase subunit A [Pseudoflavonifractor sp. BIOML-A18]MTS63871.1 V-type ATP synthase subunit A [Pseudoflavonifractor sp. BIOML-A5]MTS72123.1 V-type ATP synthase subunit A [Pseudoflavonifractor sp. BIOML-A8]MTS91263.1 V-type ATP synthase s
MSQYVIKGVNGPVVTVVGGHGLAMMDMVHVGEEGLIGEVVGVNGGVTTVQVYEDTAGLAPGQRVESTGAPMSVKLGPGLLSNIFDGIARPLRVIEEKAGPFITRGINISALDEEKLWDTKIALKVGDEVKPGTLYATCRETTLITHRCLAPIGVTGKVTRVMPDGAYNVNKVLVEVTDEYGRMSGLKLSQECRIRTPRPMAERLPIDRPLITGQRIIDTLFPIGKGGAAAIPGPFGAGKTMTQHQLAKWSDADIIVYLGCGERGNEMTQALEEFSELLDPKSHQPLMNRTILIANTSNMPVAAREASVYTGMTIAEYYRDMGYHVALMADSTSRWAEALREISGRLEEMPAEEGFPAYLASRLAEFYERAGYVRTLEGKEGSVTVIGAVSPQGGDFSEPVTQNTKRYVRTFWGLDRALAYARHFPSINWLTSYSEYAADLKPWYDANVGLDFVPCRIRISNLLQEEASLMEIVKLIGADILPEDQKLVIETAKLIRVGFLQQNAYHEIDTYVPMGKQLKMMQLILRLYDGAKHLIGRAIPLSQLKATGIFDTLTKMKYEIANDQLEKFSDYERMVDEALDKVELANR